MRWFEPLKHTKHGTTWLDWMFSTNDMSHSTGFDTGTTSNNPYIFLQKMKTNDGTMLTEPVLERRKIRNCWELVYVDKIFWQWNPGPQLCAFFHFFNAFSPEKVVCVSDFTHFNQANIPIRFSYLSSFQNGLNGPSTIISSHFMIKSIMTIINYA